MRSVPLFPPRFFCSWVRTWVKTLSRWAGTDRILVEEFNDNWDKIDTALKGSADAMAAETAALEAEVSALQTAVASYGNCHIEFGQYTGSGATGVPRVLNFQGTPIVVLVQIREFTNGDRERMILVRGTKQAYNIQSKPCQVTWSNTSVSWVHNGEAMPFCNAKNAVLLLCRTAYKGMKRGPTPMVRGLSHLNSGEFRYYGDRAFCVRRHRQGARQ